MNAIELASWLLHQSDRATEQIVRESSVVTARVATLRGELESTAPEVTEQMVLELRGQLAALDAEIAALRRDLDAEHQRLLSQVTIMFGRLKAVAEAQIIQDTQTSFDDRAPAHLRAPVATASLAMLEADLRQSNLADVLRDEADAVIQRWTSQLNDYTVFTELKQAEQSRAELRAELDAITASLERHSLAAGVLDGISQVEDLQAFVTEVLKVYTDAATLEHQWQTAAFDLKEIGLVV